MNNLAKACIIDGSLRRKVIGSYLEIKSYQKSQIKAS